MPGGIVSKISKKPLDVASGEVEITEGNDGDGGNRPSGGAGVCYVGASFGSNAHDTLNNEAYTLADAEFRYEWEGVRLRLNVSNLFDKE